VALHKYFDVEQQGPVTVMTLIGEDQADHLLVNEIQRAIVAFVEQERPHRLIVDFVNVRRFSSETINALLRARRRLVEYQGEMRLCGMRPEVREVFRLMRLDGTVFDVFEDRTEATRDFA